MRDKLELGPTPCEEDCEQLGHDYDPTVARTECRRFANGLAKYYAASPGIDRLRFGVSSNPHDFGTYHEVYVSYDPEDEEACALAYKIEASAPKTWEDLDNPPAHRRGSVLFPEQSVIVNEERDHHAKINPEVGT